MTRSELIQRITHKQPLLAGGEVELAVKVMLEHMTACLAAGGRIEIRGFGSFSLHFRRGRDRAQPQDRNAGRASPRSTSRISGLARRFVSASIGRPAKRTGTRAAGNDFPADADSPPGTGRGARSACA